jgi:hypothetical protein
VPTPGFEPVDAVEVGVLVDPDEHPARRVEAPAPSMTTPPVAAPRERNVRRLNPLPDATGFPHPTP